MASKNTSQVSTTIPKALFDALDEHRWSVRLKMTDLFRVALNEYAEKHGVEWSEDDTDADATEQTETK